MLIRTRTQPVDESTVALALSEADLPVLLVYARTTFLQEPRQQNDIQLPKSLQVDKLYHQYCLTQADRPA